jgi:drug/metabolite transporter (DMT)-like permease
MMLILVIAGKASFNFNKKRLVIFLGVVNGVAYMLEYVGMASTTASKSSLFINLSAVWVALVAPFLLREQLGGKKAIGVGVSMAGVVLMTTNLNIATLTQGAIIGDIFVVGESRLGNLHGI